MRATHIYETIDGKNYWEFIEFLSIFPSSYLRFALACLCVLCSIETRFFSSFILKSLFSSSLSGRIKMLKQFSVDNNSVNFGKFNFNNSELFQTVSMLIHRRRWHRKIEFQSQHGCFEWLKFNYFLSFCVFDLLGKQHKLCRLSSVNQVFRDETRETSPKYILFLRHNIPTLISLRYVSQFRIHTDMCGLCKHHLPS